MSGRPPWRCSPRSRYVCVCVEVSRLRRHIRRRAERVNTPSPPGIQVQSLSLYSVSASAHTGVCDGMPLYAEREERHGRRRLHLRRRAGGVHHRRAVARVASSVGRHGCCARAGQHRLSVQPAERARTRRAAGARLPGAPREHTHSHLPALLSGSACGVGGCALVLYDSLGSFRHACDFAEFVSGP